MVNNNNLLMVCSNLVAVKFLFTIPPRRLIHENVFKGNQVWRNITISEKPLNIQRKEKKLFDASPQF